MLSLKISIVLAIILLIPNSFKILEKDRVNIEFVILAARTATKLDTLPTNPSEPLDFAVLPFVIKCLYLVSEKSPSPFPYKAPLIDGLSSPHLPRFSLFLEFSSVKAYSHSAILCPTGSPFSSAQT